MPGRLQEHRVREVAERAGVVAGRLRGDAQPGGAGGADHVGDLVRIGRVRDGGGALVDREVESLASGVVAVVPGQCDGATAEVTEGGDVVASGIDDRHGPQAGEARLPAPCQNLAVAEDTPKRSHSTGTDSKSNSRP